MIIDAFMSILNGLLSGVVGFFPSWDLGITDQLASAGTYLGDGLGVAGRFFPVGTLGICLGLLVGARMALLGWTVVKWIYSVIPFKMT